MNTQARTGKILLVSGVAMIVLGLALAAALDNAFVLVVAAVGVFDIVLGLALRSGRLSSSTTTEQAAEADSRTPSGQHAAPELGTTAEGRRSRPRRPRTRGRAEGEAVYLVPSDGERMFVSCRKLDKARAD